MCNEYKKKIILEFHKIKKTCMKIGDLGNRDFMDSMKGGKKRVNLELWKQHKYS